MIEFKKKTILNIIIYLVIRLKLRALNLLFYTEVR